MFSRGSVYLFINHTRQEVFFHPVGDLRTFFSEMPEELHHWDLRKEEICTPVLIEEDLSRDEAVTLVRELEEKSLRNPQGKIILRNHLCGGEPS